MCVVAVKYIKGFGFCGAKNRDRNYATKIKVINSNRNDVQRLYIDDQTTRWTEGINEFGLGIVSASFSVQSDEKEGEKVLAKNKSKSPMVSPDGLAIRNALLLDNPKTAAKYLIENELAGATFIFNRETCYLLEGGFTVKKADSTKEAPREYVYNLKEITKKDGYAVRTNHGIDMPMLGYSAKSDDPNIKKSRDSSEERWKIVNNYLRDTKIVEPSGLLDAMSQSPNKDVFMNPIRMGDPKKGDMCTTGQLLVLPAECTLHYRPIFSSVEFNYNKLSNETNKTFFEIISSRKLLSFSQFVKKDQK